VTREPKPALDARKLYLGDNGRCFCGKLACAGMTAYFTGRDISGQRVHKLTPLAIRESVFKCEGCGAMGGA
jgi:hypothetical protein